MSNYKEWFEIVKYKDYLFIIREKLSEIEPRFYTEYINLFLLLGSKKALLIDTGMGLFPLKPIVDEIIEDRELMVINTHSHFDHRGGNNEFNKIYIHENEVDEISNPFDISFLKESPNQIVKRYQDQNFILPGIDNIQSLKDGDEFNLNGIQLKILHTPGHSNGSICLLTNKRELFTGDIAHYGSMYLPTKEEFPIILESISKLISLSNSIENLEIYPSHEEFAVDKDLLLKLHNGIQNLENLWKTRTYDDFLEGYIIKDDNFRYIVQRGFE